MLSRRRKLPIHLTFEPHPDGQRYQFGNDIRTVIDEDGYGNLLNSKDIPMLTRRSSRSDLWEAISRGKQVVSGETATPAQLKRLRTLHRRLFYAEELSSRTLTVSNIQRYFRAFGRYMRFRHFLIRTTIKRLIGGGMLPAKGYYGTVHSTLAVELRKKGTSIHRKTAPTVFSYCNELIRRFTLSESPANISPFEYKRAFVSATLFDDRTAPAILHKSSSKLTPKQLTFLSHLDRALLYRLTESQIDQIIALGRGELFLPALFEMNNLPQKPSVGELNKFLYTHSGFFRKNLKKKRN